MVDTHPCTQTGNGEAGKTLCERISSVPAKVAVCGDCSCSWRKMGVKAADPTGGLPSVADQFMKFGMRSGSPGASDFAFSATGGGAQKPTGIG